MNLKIKIGKKAYKNSLSDYEGMTGTIKYCNSCCKENRIQFDKIANNEALANFNILKCKIYEP